MKFRKEFHFPNFVNWHFSNNFCEIDRNSLNSRNLISAKINSFKLSITFSSQIFQERVDILRTMASNKRELTNRLKHCEFWKNNERSMFVNYLGVLQRKQCSLLVSNYIALIILYSTFFSSIISFVKYIPVI